MDLNLAMFSEGLLKGLAPDEAEAFINKCQQKTYSDTTVLFDEMSEANRLYLLVSGQIELQFKLPADKGMSTLATRNPGDAVGWSTVVPPHEYRFSGICKGSTTVLEIDRLTLQSLFSTNYHLAYIFMRNIAVLSGDRLNRVQEKLARVLCDEAIHGW